MKIVGLIVARSGSKGVPNKNILKFKGKTLLEMVANIASKSSDIQDAFISTDSVKYGTIALESGVRFPWKRPPELAQDQTSISDVILHAVKKENLVEKGFTHLILFQPSSPFVTSEDVEKAVGLIDKGFNSVVSAIKLDHKDVHYAFSDVEGKCNWLVGLKNSFGNRQNFKNIYKRCGNFYLFNISDFVSSNMIVHENCGFVEIEPSRALCIDEEEDLVKLKELENNDERRS